MDHHPNPELPQGPQQPPQQYYPPAPEKPKGLGPRFLEFCRRHNFRPRSVTLTIIGIGVGLLLAALIGLGVSTVFQTKTTKLGFEDIGFLETQSSFYTAVESIKKAREEFGITIPFTTSNYIFTYDGEITAGVDFSKIEVRVDESNREIHVKLPEATVSSNEIDNDSFAIFEESKNIFTPLSPDDMNEAQIRIKETTLKNAIDNGLLTRASKNAEALVRGFLSGLYDLNEYHLIFD